MGGILIFLAIFAVVFVVAVGAILLIFVFRLRTWDRDNKSPRLTVDARVLSKNEKTTSEEKVDKQGHYYYLNIPHYFLTFQVESGDKMSFEVGEGDYRTVSEGDFGKLSFQGTRYFGFVKNF
ncbi:MAG: DUF2500 domain-containing protein [Johnsonella sp.]|nr:DUF2500 domain-containing protein [Johnsonella sp.]